MAPRKVVIAGSGIVGTTMAHELARHGVFVEVVEKGPAYPYPHRTPFEWQTFYGVVDTRHEPPSDLKGLTTSGSYARNLNGERLMVVGGSATRWGGMCDRMHPNDFRTQTLYRYGADWPITYEDLEPYYSRAEAFLGVSGSDDGDPYAPSRSQPYPLPPFELGYDTKRLVERLHERGIWMRTSPQARTRAAYDGRPACVNFGTCAFCPIGARYSPNHHLERALAGGRCHLRSDTSVRRIVLDAAGRARAVVCRRNDESGDFELAGDAIVVAGGAIESARLLLLSTDGRRPDGIGNEGGHVGRNLLFHHIWSGHLDFGEDLFPGRTGPEMAQSRQFLDPPTRGRHGGVLLQLPSSAYFPFHAPSPDLPDGAAVLEAMRAQLRCELVWMHAETATDAGKAVRLGERRDRFGDPFAHVEYRSSTFDHDTHAYARDLLDRVALATGARQAAVREAEDFTSGFHHMGTCRMGWTAADSVVDGFCRVHGSPNLYVVGGSAFAGSSAVHPTLTMVALALRAVDHLLSWLP